MPVQPIQPGVLVEEVSSGLRPITGGPTAVTAFLGRAPFGPTDAPRTVSNFSDFERLYGGLLDDYRMSAAVSLFFLHGGSQAIICRLTNGGVKARTTGLELSLEAANEGAWGNGLSVAVDRDGLLSAGQPTPQAIAVAKQFAAFGVEPGDLFNLDVTWSLRKGRQRTETFQAVCVNARDKAPNRLDSVLEHQSMLIRVAMDDQGRPLLPSAPPPDGTRDDFSDGEDGSALSAADYLGNENDRTGLFMLDKAGPFNLLCIPPDRRAADTAPGVLAAAARYCYDHRAMFIVDGPEDWLRKANKGRIPDIEQSFLGIVGEVARNAAVYFPAIVTDSGVCAASGAVAGIYASTDRSRGVWKAPAGRDAALLGVRSLELDLNNDQNGALNTKGINCLRRFSSIGHVVWGARTLRGADVFSDEYKYVPVRRLALYLETSILEGTTWAVFEPNNESLWASLRQSIDAFLQDLWRKGAFHDYNVVCDATTTTPEDIAQGIVRILVMFAPLKPAEFIVLTILIRGQAT